jgi:hypothetical protein
LSPTPLKNDGVRQMGWWLFPINMESHKIQPDNQTTIELDDGKIYRKPLYLMVKTMVSCKFSLKPIHWDNHWNLEFPMGNRTSKDHHPGHLPRPPTLEFAFRRLWGKKGPVSLDFDFFQDIDMVILCWLVVWTILKNISQWEGLSHILWKIKKMFETTNQYGYFMEPTKVSFTNKNMEIL